MEEIQKKMDEIRQAAWAYFEAGTQEQQKVAENWFSAMDLNKDGSISFPEFRECFREDASHPMLNHDFFKQLDKNGNGSLDFREFLTLYYIFKSSRPFCDVCGVFQTGLYFTCLTCHECSPNTFDLCYDCYGKRRFSHAHPIILDNFLLAAYKRGLSLEARQGSSRRRQESPIRRQESSRRRQESSRGEKVRTAFEALEIGFEIGKTGFEIGSFAANFCSIM